MKLICLAAAMFSLSAFADYQTGTFKCSLDNQHFSTYSISQTAEGLPFVELTYQTPDDGPMNIRGIASISTLKGTVSLVVPSGIASSGNALISFRADGSVWSRSAPCNKVD